MTEELFLKIFHQSFKGIVTFKKRKDLEALRYFVDSELLDQWVNHWSSLRHPDKPDYTGYVVKKITPHSGTFEVDFIAMTSEGKIHDKWTFARVAGSWKLINESSSQSKSLAA